MSKTNFSKRFLEKAPAKEKRYNIFDSETRGLGIAIYPSGQKSFFHLRKVQGWPERTTIGSFPEMTVEQARGKASELNGKLSRWRANDYEGPNPLERHSRTLTFGELLKDYIARHLNANAKHPERAAAEAQWMCDKYLASWSGRKLVAIQRKQVIDLLHELGEQHGQITANRVVELIRRLFYFAEKSELHAGENPARRIAMYSERKRARFLNGNELAHLFTAMRKEPNRDLVDFVNLALWTGARRSDVLSMQWVDVALEDNRWTIPNPKNSTPYVVPLTPEAVKILKDRLRKRSQGKSNGDLTAPLRHPETIPPRGKDLSPWVFPSRGKTGHVVELKGAWKKLITRAGIADIHIHDLRRTLGSWQAAMGASLPIIGKSLGHSSTVATAIYARLDLEPVRESVTVATQAMIAASKKKPKQLTVGAP